jgi:diguanylate cyclase (GGDEF)-like protein/PAS domain S-box-containing protein
MFSVEILMQAVMESQDGVTLADATSPDCPLIFVNPAFERMTGYSSVEILRRNCRCLQGSDREQRNIGLVRDAIQKGGHCRVNLRNYRKDGSVFWNELSISPVLSQAGVLTHFIGIQKDVTERVVRQQRLLDERKFLMRSKAELEQLIIHDALTGVYSRGYFDNQLHSLWNRLANTGGSVIMMFIDIDYFKLFNDSYGHVPGDSALRQVAAALQQSLRRDGEFVARYGGEEFVVLATEMTAAQALARAQALCLHIRNLNIPHAASAHGFLTISCGVASMRPEQTNNPESLLQQADLALYQAKATGRNQAIAYNIARQAES